MDKFPCWRMLDIIRYIEKKVARKERINFLINEMPSPWNARDRRYVLRELSFLLSCAAPTYGVPKFKKKGWRALVVEIEPL